MEIQALRSLRSHRTDEGHNDHRHDDHHLFDVLDQHDDQQFFAACNEATLAVPFLSHL